MTTTDTRARVEELLRRRLAREASTRESEWPLTVGQQAMLYLYESEGRSSAYVLGEAVRLRGPRNDAAFNGAVADLLVRHPILASTVAYRAGTAVQTAGRGLSDVLFREDARDQSDQRRRARLAEVLREPFLLTSAPPLRIVVLDVTEDEIVVAFALHHIAGDFWTLVLLIRDFFALYAARVGGTAADLTPITTTYAEIAAAEQDYLGSPSGKIDGHAWVDALADHSFHTGLGRVDQEGAGWPAAASCAGEWACEDPGAAYRGLPELAGGGRSSTAGARLDRTGRCSGGVRVDPHRG